MQGPLVVTGIFRGILYGLAVFATVALLTRLFTRRHPFRRLANPLYLLAFIAGAAIFLRTHPALTGPAFAPYFRALIDRKSTRLNSSHIQKSRMPSSA